jgi:hypothetical protein
MYSSCLNLIEYLTDTTKNNLFNSKNQLYNNRRRFIFSVSRLKHLYVITNSFSQFHNTFPQNTGITSPQNDLFFQVEAFCRHLHINVFRKNLLLQYS